MPLTAEQQQRLAELRAKAGKETPMEFATRAVTEPAAQVLSGPMEIAGALGESIDPYTGAPVRAAVGELQHGGRLSESVPRAAKAFKEQITAGKVLPSTPSGEDITYKGLTSAGISPFAAQPTAEAVGPLVGAGLDLTNLTIPFGGAPATAAVRGAAKVPGAALKGAVKLGEVLEPLGYKAAQKTFELGNIATQGTLDVPSSMKATKNLTAMEQLFPGNKYFGPSKKAYQELNQVRESIASGYPEVVPGSSDTAKQLAIDLAKAKDKALSAPNVGALSEKLQRLAEGNPEGLTVQHLDELLSNVDQMKHTPAGNPRQVQSILKKDISNTRQALVNEIKKSETGQDLLDARSRSADLMTVQKGRGKLMDALGRLATVPSVGTSQLIRPQTYHNIIGAARLPKQAIESLDAAYNSGKIGEFKAALDRLSKSNPRVTESLMKEILLAPGRVDNGPSNIPEMDLSKLGMPINVPTYYERGK